MMNGIVLIAYPIIAVLLVFAGYAAGHHDAQHDRARARPRFFDQRLAADTPRPLSFSPPRLRKNTRSDQERPGTHRKGRKAFR